MSNPTVAVIMLVNGRHDMVQRAIRCFREQTYQNARLVIWDTGTPWMPTRHNLSIKYRVDHYQITVKAGMSIGNLRNMAISALASEVIIHFDSDDWSHPRRIEEQVALLQASGKDCVGYRDMLFWYDQFPNMTPANRHAAFLYSNPQPSYALGTSLCYWRSAWERHPFADLPKYGTGAGEDAEFIRSVDTLGVACVAAQDEPEGNGDDMDQPRMIASLHGDNTSTITALAIKHGDSMIRRVPEWDSFCREKMAL